MTNEIKKVFFTCKKKLLNGKPQEYCQCDGCFRVTTVSVMKFPQTRYWNHRDLTTKYTTRWYCDDCLAKLHKAISDNRIKYLFTSDVKGK